MIRLSYSELIKLDSFNDRLNYLKLDGVVGADTFGDERYINQLLYRSKKWRSFRNEIIIRDNGCDLACDGFIIYQKPTIHHLNPITVEDILSDSPSVFDPENVVTTVHNTHMAIHYGREITRTTEPVIRAKNDTCPWRK